MPRVSPHRGHDFPVSEWNPHTPNRGDAGTGIAHNSVNALTVTADRSATDRISDRVRRVRLESDNFLVRDSNRGERDGYGDEQPDHQAQETETIHQKCQDQEDRESEVI